MLMSLRSPELMALNHEIGRYVQKRVEAHCRAKHYGNKYTCKLYQDSVYSMLYVSTTKITLIEFDLVTKRNVWICRLDSSGFLTDNTTMKMRDLVSYDKKPVDLASPNFLDTIVNYCIDTIDKHWRWVL